MSNRIRAGEEILSYCGKCKLALAHVVVALKDNGTIGKCECKTCAAVHLYKDPDNMGKKKAKAAPKDPKIPVEQLWKTALAKAKGELKPYFMSETYKAGDIIEHPTFGKGVVELVVSDNKIQALFEHDVKMLACAR